MISLYCFYRGVQLIQYPGRDDDQQKSESWYEVNTTQGTQSNWTNVQTKPLIPSFPA